MTCQFNKGRGTYELARPKPSRVPATNVMRSKFVTLQLYCDLLKDENTTKGDTILPFELKGWENFDIHEYLKVREKSKFLKKSYAGIDSCHLNSLEPILKRVKDFNLNFIVIFVISKIWIIKKMILSIGIQIHCYLRIVDDSKTSWDLNTIF